MKKLAILLFILPLIIGGVVVGLAMKRIINIPGLTPKKKKSSQTTDKQSQNQSPDGSKDAGKDQSNSKAADKGDVAKKSGAKAPAKKNDDTAAKTPKEDALDPASAEKGAAKIAAVWGEMKPEDLVKLVPHYKEKELALILRKMDEGTVATLLTKLDPDQAAKLSHAIELSAAKANQ